MKTLILIPAFNEEKNIENLISKIKLFDYDYLIINDCSSDKTAEILSSKKLNNIRLVNNMGIANVLQGGYRYAYEYGYDAVITIDGDGQHNPKYIFDLLAQLEEGFDYVIGSRFVTNKKPFNLRMIGSKLLTYLIKIKTGKTITDPTSGMKVIGRNVLQAFSDNNNFVAEPDTVVYLLRNGYKVTEIQVEMDERKAGESHFSSIVPSIKYMVHVILSLLFIQNDARRRGKT